VHELSGEDDNGYGGQDHQPVSGVHQGIFLHIHKHLAELLKLNDAQQNVVFWEDLKQCSQYPSDLAPKQLFDANQSTPGKFECIGRRRSAWCTKAELSGR
jgi:hypothetical protein